MLDKKLVTLRFSKNAKHYDKYASIQRKMADHLVRFSGLNRLSPRNILDVGSGTGFLTEKLLDLFPHASITALDIASGMIEVSKKKLGTKKNLKFVCGDAEIIDFSPSSYDLIASNATFQWFNNLSRTLKKLWDALSCGGVLCFSTFGSKTFNELHRSYEVVSNKFPSGSSIRIGQEFYSPLQIKTMLRGLCASDLEIKFEELVEYVYFDSAVDFFESIRKIGASNSTCGCKYRSPALIRELINVYERDYNRDDKIYATYHCLYFSVKKPE